jgi:iron complex outermembrane receptor protein
MTWMPAKSQVVRIAWTELAGAQGSLHGLQSEYALNYPVENIHAAWTALLGRYLSLTNAVRIARPYQQPGIAPWNANPYPVWDASLTHDSGKLRPYLRLGNLSNTGYQEINGVAMPGRSITGGVSFWLGR